MSSVWYYEAHEVGAPISWFMIEMTGSYEAVPKERKTDAPESTCGTLWRQPDKNGIHLYYGRYYLDLPEKKNKHSCSSGVLPFMCQVEVVEEGRQHSSDDSDP